MKVLYIADELTQSGAIKSFEEMVTRMHDDLGVDCTVIVSEESHVSEKLSKKGIPVVAAHYGSYMQNCPITWWKVVPKYLLAGLKYYRNERKALDLIEQSVNVRDFDLIHANVNRIDVGVELSRRSGVPNVMHIREFGDADFKCWSYRPGYIGYLNSYVSQFIAISEAVKANWVRRGIAEDKVKVIYNGVNSGAIKEKSADSDGKKLKLVIVGGVIPAKGQMQAIQAMALLPGEIRENVTLDIIGWSSKEYFSVIKKEIRNLGLENNVKLLGARNDVYERLQNYDVGLMCSKAEGFGRVTVEYMHARLGVIASNCGANPELIDDGVTGLLYQYSNESDLARCIEAYFSDRQLLHSCARNGRELAAEKYTSEINAKNVRSLYKKLVG